jgi:D-aminopeptidase
VPLILVTGDDVMEKEVEAFSPATEYVVVKTAEAAVRSR